MKSRNVFLFLILLGIFVFLISWAVSSNRPLQTENHKQFDKRIDNIGYWLKLAQEGHIPFNPEIRAEQAIFTGKTINAFSVVTNDSPDVPVTDINSTQSENSVFVSPTDADILLNSNNSTENPVPTLGGKYGANDLYSFNNGETWEGEITGAGSDNNGDPTTAIGLNGRWYINYINNNLGQGISYSDDEGATWITKTVAPNPGEIADKNHMWIDNSPSSLYEGNLYVAWTDFGGENHEDIVLARSIDDGETWSVVGSISAATNAFDQGVHLSTGVNGEVYAFWAVYDMDGDENAIGFSKSLDGGETWSTAARIIDDIRGIKLSGTSKNIRVNSFPVSAVDLSDGAGSGNIYVVWANRGRPGINVGSDVDIYLLRSEDSGETWSDPIRVNQDEAGQGKEHFFPWISCDPSNGYLSVIFYDDRNVSETQCEVFCANSDDGGESWEDFKVSDVAFTPAPIPGLAVYYFGDYLGITSRNNWVYPVWTDNRMGHAMSWCSPYQTNNLNRPVNLLAEVEFETGLVSLNWEFNMAEGFQYFNIYRNNVLIDTTTKISFIDQLPVYGSYKYRLTAVYTEGQESGGTTTQVQWGSAEINLSSNHVFEHLTIDSSSQRSIEISNSGQLDLVYNINREFDISGRNRNYCPARGGGGEYIGQVQFGDIDNTSGSNEYSDYTHLSTFIEEGEFYTIEVTNGNAFDIDQCGAWIDWDQNGEFDDGLIEFIGSPGPGPYTTTFTPPIGAKTGATRLRIRITYTGDLDPCGNKLWGEVEDYTVYVKNWYGAYPLIDTIPAGETNELTLTFDATDYETGLQTTSLFVNSNDPLQSQSKVDLSMNVSELLVGISTENGKTTFCSGEMIQLTATPFGVYDSPEYSWTSIPEGFESNRQNPIVSPTDSLWYFVEMSSSSGTSTDSIFLNILPQPQFDLGPDTTYCGDTTLLLNAGEDGVLYQWSTGENTPTITVDTTTLYNGFGLREISVLVYNGLKCATKDTVRLEFVNCTGMRESRINHTVDIYPNPNEGIFQVRLGETVPETVDVIIFNQSGRIIFSESNTRLKPNKTLEINLKNQAKGVYHLFVKAKNCDISRKIIVK